MGAVAGALLTESALRRLEAGLPTKELAIEALELLDALRRDVRRLFFDAPPSNVGLVRPALDSWDVDAIGSALDGSLRNVSGTAATTIPMYRSAATKRPTQGVQRQVNTAEICRSIGVTAAPWARIVSAALPDNRADQARTSHRLRPVD